MTCTPQSIALGKLKKLTILAASQTLNSLTVFL